MTREQADIQSTALRTLQRRLIRPDDRLSGPTEIGNKRTPYQGEQDALRYVHAEIEKMLRELAQYT